jgi:hypothetical protein
MTRDKAKEGSCRLGALLQIYIGPKMFQALMGTMTTLPEPDVRISNEAKGILETVLPTFGMGAFFPAITTEHASHDSLKHGPFKVITSLIQKIEPTLEDFQGPGPAIHAYRFSWNAVYYLQLRKYAPNHERDFERCRKALIDHSAPLGLKESQVQEFLADPKDRWGSTFDLVVAEQKRSFLERLMPKEPKYPLDGEAADDVIRRWLAGM